MKLKLSTVPSKNFTTGHAEAQVVLSQLSYVHPSSQLCESLRPSFTMLLPFSIPTNYTLLSVSVLHQCNQRHFVTVYVCMLC